MFVAVEHIFVEGFTGSREILVERGHGLPQRCIRREGTSEVAHSSGWTGGWRRLPKRLGAVTVGYKCH